MGILYWTGFGTILFGNRSQAKTNQDESKSVRVMAWFLHLQRWENPGKFQTNPFEIGNISGFGVLHWGGYLHLKFFLWNTNMPRQFYTQVLLYFFLNPTLSFLQASTASFSYRGTCLKTLHRNLFISNAYCQKMLMQISMPCGQNPSKLVTWSNKTSNRYIKSQAQHA